MLEHIVPRIIDESNHTFQIQYYNGIGHLPKRAQNAECLRHEALLNDLPRMLKAYGKTFAGYGDIYKACIIVVCDLDSRCLFQFKGELLDTLSQCNPAPETRFCIAIEEGEAWLLGDINAIRTAYPTVKLAILNGYSNDSICGTSEILEEAIGNKNKSEWAERISPHVRIDSNASPSFKYFVSKVKELAE
jgi:hypothetical protein